MTRLIKKIFIPTIIFAWSVCYYIEILGAKASAGYFVKPVFWILAVLYVIIMAKEFLAWKAEIPKEAAERENKQDEELMRTAICIGSAVIYLVVMPWLGFIISTVLLLFGLFCWLKAPNKIGAFVLAVAITAGIYALFNFGLKVPLYKGIINF